jgi:hypothetical protein
MEMAYNILVIQVNRWRPPGRSGNRYEDNINPLKNRGYYMYHLI